jgi:hypothetical protein
MTQRTIRRLFDFGIPLRVNGFLNGFVVDHYVSKAQSLDPHRIPSEAIPLYLIGLTGALMTGTGMYLLEKSERYQARWSEERRKNSLEEKGK